VVIVTSRVEADEDDDGDDDDAVSDSIVLSD
jgi:hypothetical protein